MSATLPALANLDARIRAEQIRMLYRQLPTSVAGAMVGALLLAGTMIGQRPLWLIGAWLACMAANQAWRTVLYLRNRNAVLDARDAGRAGALWATGSGISGVLWGLAAFVFFVSGEAVHQTVLTIIVFGVTAGAVPLIASHAPSFYVFVFPALLPFVVRNAMEGDAPHVVLSAVVIAVTIGILSFGRNYNRMLTESLRNRFEKQALAEQLVAQNVDLEKARVAAEQANRAKTQFFAAASHDLRQPLHAMGLFAGALAQKVKDPEVTGVIASIDASVKALEALFNELLDMSKIDSGVIKPRFADFPLEEVFGRLKDEFAAEAQAKGLRLTIASGGHVVRSDALLLERIVRNLVGNAIRYTTEGSIALTASREDGEVRIEVRDTGIGIRDQGRQRIFEEFFQVGNPGRTSKKGLGLGLSIVRRLCALLGTTISLESELGRGSVFAFRVPLGSAPAARSAAPSAPARRGDLSGKLIVVIDDEAAIMEAMQRLLSGWGAEVIGSLSGEDVLAEVHARERMPDLIVADYRLAGMDTGVDVIERLRRALDPEIPAILVTGSTTPETLAEAHKRQLGMLLKPVLPERLREVIDASLPA